VYIDYEISTFGRIRRETEKGNSITDLEKAPTLPSKPGAAAITISTRGKKQP